jgi:hypothetical protein
MTIEKAMPWGAPIVVPLTTRDVDSDWQLARGSASDIHILSGGDLFSSLGEPVGITPGDTRTLVRIDAMECSIIHTDSTTHIRACSSVEIGRWLPTLASHRYVVVTNGGIVHHRHIAPRAHPNDGFIDAMCMDPTMSRRDRINSRRRARLGNHLPHPHITVQRGQSFSFSRQRSRESLRIDNELIPLWTAVHIEVKPDYWQVIV